MIQQFKYTCQFCGRLGTVKADLEGVQFFGLDKWLERVACNRCADYMTGRRERRERIGEVALYLRPQLKPTQQVKDKAALGLRKLLEDHQNAVARHVGAVPVHEDGWLEAILSDPSASLIMLDRMEKSIADRVEGKRPSIGPPPPITKPEAVEAPITQTPDPSPGAKERARELMLQRDGIRADPVNHVTEADGKVRLTDEAAAWVKKLNDEIGALK